MANLEKNFHKSLEQDIDRLESEISQVSESHEGRSFESKEVVKKSFKQISKKQDYKQSDGDKDAVKRESIPEREDEFLPDYMEKRDVSPEEKVRVEKLMDMVIHKGILKALKVSKKEEPFIQDAFHDALAEKLLPVLKEKGILK